jgi:hypothetical protein
VGKRADIVVWDHDPYMVATDQIKDLKCLVTLFDGEVVYTSLDSSVTTAVRQPNLKSGVPPP